MRQRHDCCCYARRDILQMDSFLLRQLDRYDLLRPAEKECSRFSCAEVCVSVAFSDSICGCCNRYDRSVADRSAGYAAHVTDRPPGSCRRWKRHFRFRLQEALEWMADSPHPAVDVILIDVMFWRLGSTIWHWCDQGNVTECHDCLFGTDPPLKRCGHCPSGGRYLCRTDVVGFTCGVAQPLHHLYAPAAASKDPACLVNQAEYCVAMEVHKVCNINRITRTYSYVEWRMNLLAQCLVTRQTGNTIKVIFVKK